MKTADLKSDREIERGFTVARAICRRHGGSFYFASFFLPAAKRDACFAIFAFCHKIREALTVESAPGGGSICSPTDLDGRMEWFRERLDEIYAGQLELADEAERTETGHVLCAAAYVVKRYEIPKPYFLEFADGRRMESTLARYPTWARLEKYCYHSGGVVGLILCAILGVQNSNTAAQAIKFASAIRLTAILRDMKEDFSRGRIFLPLEDMARFGYSERDLSAGIVNEKLAELMKFEIARARSLYREGAEGLCWLAEDGSRLAAAALGVMSAQTLRAIERSHYDVFSSRPRVSRAKLATRLPAAWRLAKRSDGEPLPDVF